MDTKELIGFCLFIIFPILIYLICKYLKSDYDDCYSEMEYSGIAIFGLCGGLSGGSKSTDYLSEQCIFCPHLCLSTKEAASSQRLQALLRNENLTYERRNTMNITVEQCCKFYDEGYETVIENGKITGFIDENGEFLKL